MKKILVLLLWAAISAILSCDDDKGGTLKEQLPFMAYLNWLDNNPVAAVPAPCPAVAYGAPAPADAPLAAEGDYFRDDQGRVVILRGVNMAGNSKVPPFMPITGASMLDPLPAWGFNTIRLLFTWEAFEPTRCTFESSYLSYYEQVVQWAQARGIYVMVDFHQDAYSRFSLNGCGEGFPSWAVTPAVGLKTPDNGPACSSWGVMMVFDAMQPEDLEGFSPRPVRDQDALPGHGGSGGGPSVAV